ncbi:hypothetical protein DEJ50_14540 [Streptomyces venezuelae]|uniref:Uncharacterized protein n=1 Tax=Streptomyces venezuelae TaxID=54571 RepID=A0A5P2DDY0_STRVZ|nr:hypothetical protein DEJ50_14540 [Streptomyces venezuelae]
MRANRRTEDGRVVPTTPEEFAAGQRARLFQEGGPGAPEATNPRKRLDVALTGEATAGHTVRLAVLGPFLANLQESVHSVAQALTGRPTTHAAIPKNIRDVTTLSAAALFPSSFGVALYGPEVSEATEGGEHLFPDPTEAVLDDAINTVLDVVDLSESAGLSDDGLAEELVPLGQRAMKHIGALTAGLTEAQIGLKVAWHPKQGRVRQSVWTPDGARRVRDLCEQSEFSSGAPMTLTGWLGSASALRGTVEIRTDNGEIIRAKTDEAITRSLRSHFGNLVRAEVEVTVVRAAGGRERRNYAVISLHSLDPDTPGST